MVHEPEDLDPEERSFLADLGERHGLWDGETPARLLARGEENVTFYVGDVVVRRSDDVEAVAREVALLRALADASPVPTPAPLLHEADLGVLAYRRLEGTPLLTAGCPPDPSVRDGLVQVLAALRRVVPGVALTVDDYPNAEWHGEALEAFESVRDTLGPERADAVERFLGQAPPPDAPADTPQHNDLGVEHLLVDGEGRLTGVIDWTDAALAPPARDAGTLLRDLGEDVALAVWHDLDGRPSDDDVARVRFHARCKWLEDVAFALEEPRGRAAYLDNAWRCFAHTFAVRD